ncbi:MAG TPA: glycerol-3-phosphate dehydrogenase/oxidase, partial [Actinomycetota bacterium]|nr:glycerol-3-phosphate dehydrogenase/oxidase [Actinomycetota bacterium]
KLVHGGLRYLAALDVGLCREAARERRALLGLAPHLVRTQPFVLPVLRGRRPAPVVGAALTLADRLAGAGPAERHRRLSAAEVLAAAPALRPDGLTGGFAFLEARTDDARLVLAVLRAAQRLGAVAVNHAEVRGVEVGRAGVLVSAVDRVSGAALGLRAGCVVNATGPWSSRTGALAGAPCPPLRPSRGVHVVLPAARLPLAAACVFPARDGRELFAVPMGGRVLVGTTDVEEPEPDRATVTSGELSYLLDALDDAFNAGVGPGDVISAWAGVRPLVAGRRGRRGGTAGVSRRHAVSRKGRAITVVGGKLTTFRRMARDAVDEACRALGRAPRPAGAVPIACLDEAAVARIAARGAGLGLDRAAVAHLLSAYGEGAGGVLDLVEHEPGLAEPLVPDLPTVAAEAVWAAREEMAVTLADVLDRRLRLALYDAAAGLASPAPELVARELGWPRLRLLWEIAAYRAAAIRERGPVPVAAP